MTLPVALEEDGGGDEEHPLLRVEGDARLAGAEPALQQPAHGEGEEEGEVLLSQLLSCPRGPLYHCQQLHLKEGVGNEDSSTCCLSSSSSSESVGKKLTFGLALSVIPISSLSDLERLKKSPDVNCSLR